MYENILPREIHRKKESTLQMSLDFFQTHLKIAQKKPKIMNES